MASPVPLDLVKTLALIVFCIIALICKIFKRRTTNPGGFPLPPGPNATAIIGNLFDIPLLQPWITYTHWSKQYGDPFHLQVFGQHIVGRS